MSTPIDTPDWIALAAAADSPAVLYDNSAVTLSPFVLPSLDTSQYASLEIAVGGTGGTTNDTVQVLVQWQQANVLVGFDAFTLWGSTDPATPNAAAFGRIPCRGNSALVILTSLANGTTVSVDVVGSRRVVTGMFFGSYVDAYAPNLLAENNVPTTAGQTITYRVGPVNHSIHLHMLAGGVTHAYTLYAEVPTRDGPVEVQVRNGTATVGNPTILENMIMPGCALRAVITNNGASAGQFVLAVTGD